MYLINNKSIYIAVVFLGLFLAACGKKKTEAQNNESAPIETSVSLTDAQLKNANIEVGKIENKAISTVLKVNGKIDVPPQNMVSISMPLGGYLKTTKLLPGMYVKKGEVIATLEDQQYIQLQQDYLTTKNKIIFSEKELQRQKELNESQAASDKVYQQALMEYNAQKIALSALTEKLKLINVNPNTLSETNLSKNIHIFSPIAGFVSKVNVNIGKYVTPSDVMFELVNPSDIHLSLKIFEKDLAKLSVGQKLAAFTNTQPDKKHPCEIILISQNVDEDHSAEVHCHFKDYDKSLLPGMYMNAEIELKNINSLALPEGAIVNFEGKDYIFEVDGNNQYKMTAVKLGNKENGFVEILDGDALKSKNLVTKGAYTLLMKMKNKSEE